MAAVGNEPSDASVVWGDGGKDCRLASGEGVKGGGGRMEIGSGEGRRGIHGMQWKHKVSQFCFFEGVKVTEPQTDAGR